MNIQDWFLLGLTGLISFQSKGLSSVFSNITVQKQQFFNTQLSLWSKSHIHTWLLEKPQLWLCWHYFVGKVMSLLFNMLSRLVIAFLPRSKCLNFMAAVNMCSDFGAQENSFVTVSTVSPSICHEAMGLDTKVLFFWMFELLNVELPYDPPIPLLGIYWVGQKVHLGFSIRCYGKTWLNFFCQHSILKKQNRIIRKDPSIQGSRQHYLQQMEATQVSINRWLD